AKDSVTPEDSHEIEKDLEVTTNSPKMFETRDADEAHFSPTNFPTPSIDDINETEKGIAALGRLLERRKGKVDEVDAVGEVQSKLMKVLHGLGYGDHQLADLARNPEFRAVHFGRIQTAASALKKKKLVNYDGSSKVSLVEAEQKPIDTYKGWKIYTLSDYTTPYYYPEQHWFKDRQLGGPAENYPRIKKVHQLIDKWLKRMGKETLDEAETWGKSVSDPNKLQTKKQVPKAVPEAKKQPTTKWHYAVVYIKRLRSKGKRNDAEYANAFLNWIGRSDRHGRAKMAPEPEPKGVSSGAAKKIKQDIVRILKKEIHWVDSDEVDKLFGKKSSGTSTSRMDKIRKAPPTGWKYEK
ncbi:hypothetical protein LCGC14_2453060, partial [marine sediment metagenome]